MKTIFVLFLIICGVGITFLFNHSSQNGADQDDQGQVESPAKKSLSKGSVSDSPEKGKKNDKKVDAKIVNTSVRKEEVTKSEIISSQLGVESKDRGLSRMEPLWRTPDGQQPSYKNRIVAIKGIGKSLKLTERKELYRYLREGPSDNVYDLHIKDRIMIKLENQNVNTPEYLGELMKMVEEKDLDGFFRGYAMQHLRDAYQVHPGMSSELKSSYLKGMEDKDSDVSGTALLAIAEFKGDYEEVELKKVTELMLDLIQDEEAHYPSRVTAMQLVGEMGIGKALPMVKLQANEGKGTVMKIAALNSLGYLGVESDLAFLQAILADPEKKIFHEVVRKAIQSIKSRG
ncbi:MAG: hypothetical protein HQL32_03700 [Planctomycetes bacterium]|nr:hypothetical protein [Planctomycetota bacterium]